MAGSVHHYGTGVKYGTDHRYGETAESFTAESASSPSYGNEASGLVVAFTQETASIPVYTEE